MQAGHRKKRIGRGCALIAAFALHAPSALAEEPTRQAVQVRKYGQEEEIRVAFGSMPLDPFQKGWTLSLSHTHHFNDLWAWETLQVTGAFLTSTSLRDELIGTFQSQPEEFAAPRFMVTTGLEMSPLYGKQVWLNRDTIHGSALIGAYTGVMFGDRETFSETLEDIRPLIGGGLGLRIYLSQALSARFDGRIYAVYRPAFLDGETDDVETVALLTLSISLGWGRP